MENTLIKINPQEYGIEEIKAQQIAYQFKPMLDKMVELEHEYNEVISLPIEEKETPIKAHDLRMKYVKVRTGTAAIHKIQKEFYVKAGKYIDGWKNAQLFASQGIEEKLEGIEKYAENKEKERIANLQSERSKLCTQYEFDGGLAELGKMSVEVWNNFLSGIKLAFENKKEAERKAEEERIETERLNNLEYNRKIKISPYQQFLKTEIDLRNITESEYQKLFNDLMQSKIDYEEEQELIRLENERLKAEAEEKERLAEIERKKQAKILADQKAKAEAEQKKLKAEAEKKLQKEREEKAKLQEQIDNDNKLKREAETKRIKEEEAQRQAERKQALAPDKEKLMTWALHIANMDLPTVKSKEAIEIMNNANDSLKQISEYIKLNAKKL